MAKYVIKNNDLYLNHEPFKEYLWVMHVPNATIYDDGEIDQNCVPSCLYVLDTVQRSLGCLGAKLVEVEAHYTEKVDHKSAIS